MFYSSTDKLKSQSYPNLFGGAVLVFVLHHDAIPSESESKQVVKCLELVVIAGECLDVLHTGEALAGQYYSVLKLTVGNTQALQ